MAPAKRPDARSLAARTPGCNAGTHPRDGGAYRREAGQKVMRQLLM